MYTLIIVLQHFIDSYIVFYKLCVLYGSGNYVRSRMMKCYNLQIVTGIEVYKEDYLLLDVVGILTNDASDCFGQTDSISVTEELVNPLQIALW